MTLKYARFIYMPESPPKYLNTGRIMTPTPPMMTKSKKKINSKSN